MKKMNKKGFTLAELLIVVAIIAVLVAVAIPVFTTQLEKTRQATDLANIRSSYAEAMADYLVSSAATQKTGVTGTSYKMQNKEGNLKKIDTTGLDSLLQAALPASGLNGKSAAVQVLDSNEDGKPEIKIIVS